MLDENRSMDGLLSSLEAVYAGDLNLLVGLLAGLRA